jgi:hypothetical protein
MRNLILITILAAIPLVSMLRPGPYESGDMNIHAGKTIEFSGQLSQGILFPKWAPTLNAGYGYPLFLFTYQTPYYLTSLLYLSGFPAITSVKLILGFLYIVSGIGMYAWIKKLYFEKPAMVAAIFYLFAPYHLIDLHFRVAIGEIAALAVLPWCFYFLESQRKTWSSLTIAFLILSHPALSIASLPIIAVYIRWRRLSILPVLGGLLLSAYYWLPAMWEGRYTHPAAVTVQMIDWKTLFVSPEKWGLLYQGSMGQIYPTVGVIGWVSIVIAFVFFKKKLRFWIFIAGIYLIFLLPVSKPVWDHISLLRQFQFNYRLLGPVSLILAVIAGFVFGRKQKWAILFSVLMISSTVLNWGNRNTLPGMNDNNLIDGLPYFTAATEGPESRPIWSKNWQTVIPTQTLESVSEDQMKANITYFPGWKVYIDEKEVPIIQTDGLIYFTKPKVGSNIQLKFTPTPIRRIGSAISLSVLLVFFGYGIWLQPRRHIHHRKRSFYDLASGT